MWEFQGREEEKDLELESEAPLPLTATSRVCIFIFLTHCAYLFYFPFQNFLLSTVMAASITVTFHQSHILVLIHQNWECRSCICWETLHQGLRLGSRNGSNWFVNALPNIGPLASPTALQGYFLPCIPVLGYSLLILLSYSNYK